MGALTELSLGGGILGAVIKLVAGIFMLWLKNKKNERETYINLTGKQIELAREAREEGGQYFRHTRRVLAWGLCFAFASICILWAVFPGYPILKSGGAQGTEVQLLLFHWQFSRDLGMNVTTGSIVWELIPFMSMILTIYFTPDISKA